MGFRPWRTWERLQDISVSRAPSVTVGDQKPKALSETLEMLPQQIGKHTGKPEGQPQAKVSLSFTFLHGKLSPRPKGVKGVGGEGPAHSQCVGWAISSPTRQEGPCPALPIRARASNPALCPALCFLPLQHHWASAWGRQFMCLSVECCSLPRVLLSPT